MKSAAWALLALVWAAPVGAQSPCWSADRQLSRFSRAEVERLDALASLQHVLSELEQVHEATPDLLPIARGFAQKIIEQRELARELLASLERLRAELHQCGRVAQR